MSATLCSLVDAATASHLGVGPVLLPKPQRELLDGSGELEIVLLLVAE